MLYYVVPDMFFRTWALFCLYLYNFVYSVKAIWADMSRATVISYVQFVAACWIHYCAKQCMWLAGVCNQDSSALLTNTLACRSIVHHNSALAPCNR